MPLPHTELKQLITTLPFTLEETEVIQSHMFSNIATKDRLFTKTEGHRARSSLPGAVIASPMRYGPNFSQDYVFHWTRDAAITILEVIDLYKHTSSDSIKKQFHEYLIQYLEWEQIAQFQDPIHGIPVFGEPKFNIDATIWAGDWSRPQNDGPALRAIACSLIAHILLDEGQADYVNQHLYKLRPEGANLGIIKNDLDYVANHWGEKYTGLWEEVVGYHFFSELMQRRSLMEGSTLATRLEDPQMADYYSRQMRHIELLIDDHWNSNIGYYSETLKQQSYKGGGINTSIILGVVYGQCEPEEPLYFPDAEKVMSSAYYIRHAFEGLYPINYQLREKNLGPLIGRYPNDIYDGDQSIYGNPWILTTAIFASYYYLLAKALLAKKTLEITFAKKIFFQQINPTLILQDKQMITMEHDEDLLTRLITEILLAGDKMLKAMNYCGVSYIDGTTLHLSEQIDRTSGIQVSAKDLTWSYAAVLNAVRAREKLVASIQQSYFE